MVIISNCSFPLVSVTVHRTLTYAWVRRRHIEKLFGAELMRMGLDDTDLCVVKDTPQLDQLDAYRNHTKSGSTHRKAEKDS